MLLKMGTIDWSIVKGVALAFGFFALLLVPFFWWLYDTDRWMRWTERVGESPFMTIVFLLTWPGLAFREFESRTTQGYCFGVLLAVFSLSLAWRAIKAGGNPFKAA